MVCFEFKLTFKWKVGEGNVGSVSVPEYSNDEDEPTYRVCLESGDDKYKDDLRKRALKALTK